MLGCKTLAIACSKLLMCNLLVYIFWRLFSCTVDRLRFSSDSGRSQSISDSAGNLCFLFIQFIYNSFPELTEMRSSCLVFLLVPQVSYLILFYTGDLIRGSSLGLRT